MMKVMWITNIPIGEICYAYNLPRATSGGWMDALLYDLKSKNVPIVLVTTGNVKEVCSIESEGVISYLLPGGVPEHYNHKLACNRLAWKKIIDAEKPDLLHIWGTEYSHALAALEAAPHIPAVVYIQGLVSVIARYYEAGMDRAELCKSISFRDIIKIDWISMQKAKFASKGITEQEILKRASNVICENVWCRTHCLALHSQCKFYSCELNVKEVYYKTNWSYENKLPYSVMGIASNYPLKGLHMLLKAFNLVSMRYPEARLYVPGLSIVPTRGIKNKLKQTGYSLYIQRLMKKYNLVNKVVFLGSLSADEMAEWMAKVNVFVMPSALENHSSTLREAMIVGTPSIASYVGGVPEVVTHRENGLLYRFEEYEQLAQYIAEIFDNPKLAMALSDKAQESMRNNHDSTKIADKIIAIYKDIINSNDYLSINLVGDR